MTPRGGVNPPQLATIVTAQDAYLAAGQKSGRVFLGRGVLSAATRALCRRLSKEVSKIEYGGQYGWSKP